jgi:hypothetical protein
LDIHTRKNNFTRHGETDDMNESRCYTGYYISGNRSYPVIPEDTLIVMVVFTGLFLTGMRLGTRGSLRAMAQQRDRMRNERQWKADSVAMMTRLSARKKLAQMRESTQSQPGSQDLKLV